MPAKNRVYHYIESLSESSTTSTSDQTKATLTFTPVDNSTYVYLWAADVQPETSDTSDTIVTLYDNSLNVLATTNIEDKDATVITGPTNYFTLSGIAFQTFGVSAGSQSVTLKYKSEVNATTSKIKNARIIAIKLSSADAYVENTNDESSAGSTARQTATTLTFTPATAGNYLILGSCEYLTNTLLDYAEMQITHNSVAYNLAYGAPNDITNYISGMMQASLNNLSATSQSVTFDYKSPNSRTTVNCRRARLVAFRLDEFDYNNISTDTTYTSTTNIAGYDIKLSNTPAFPSNSKHLVIGTASIAKAEAGTSRSVYHKFVAQGTDINVSIQEPNNSSALPNGLFGSFTVIEPLTENSSSIQYQSTSASNGIASIYEAKVSYLSLATPNKSRKWHSAESSALSTTTATTDQTKVTLTYTPDADSTYVYIWTADIKNSNGSYDTRVSLQDGVGTILGTMNCEPRDVAGPDVITVSGIYFATFTTSPSSQSILLRYSSENSAGTASILNARIIAIKLTSADAYVDNATDQTTTSTTLQTANTLTFTPASEGRYLILGSVEKRTSSSASGINTVQLTHNSVAYSVMDTTVSDATNYVSGILQAALPLLPASSQTVTLQWKSNSASYTAYARRSRILALRLDELTEAYIATDSAATTTASTTYVTKKSISSYPLVRDLNYLVIATANVTNNSQVYSAGFGLSVAGTYVNETFAESANLPNLQNNFGAAYIYKPTTVDTATINFDYDIENAAALAGASYLTMSVLLLEPKELYWVGGSGTWDASTTTNWALTSGGTGSIRAPSAGIDTVFDSASDSGAGFTVTVNANAVCQDITASGLDQTMTLSGSGAWSIYGSLSVPSTNFTQSYTGTVTFAALNSQTITTNGKSFTAFTFNGVGGTWTLQDALTLTGTATLTNGTLTLGSSTFTCDNFTSNNSNVRTINFDTGKIAVSSSSTATVWNTATITNLTISGTPLVELTGGGATTKTISAGALAEASSISFTLSTTAGTVAFTATNTVRNLTIANNSFTVSNIAITIYGDLTIGGTSPTLTAGANVWTFAATSGTKTITTNGDTLDFPITFNGVGGTWALGDNLSIGTSTSRTLSLTAGTLDINSKNLTLFGIFGSNNTNTRRIQNTGGTGKIIMTLNTASVIWQTTTQTGLTTDGNVIVRVESGGATTKTLSPGVMSEASALSWEIAATAGTVSVTATNTIKNFTLEDTAYTLANTAIVIYGNLSVPGTTPTLTAGTSAWTFAATSGIKTLSSAENLDWPIIFDGIGGTWQLASNISVGTATARQVTLTNGTLACSTYNLTNFGTFVSNNSNTRSITSSGGEIINTLTTTSTLLNTSTSTNLSASTAVFRFTGAGATVKTINTGTLSEADAYSVIIENTTGSFTFTASNTVKNLTINSAATFLTPAFTIYGDFTTTAVTYSGSNNVITFAGTGTQIITTNNITVDRALTFNSTGTFRLGSAMTMGNRNLTFTQGTLDFNSYDLTIGSTGTFVVNGSTAKVLAQGTGNLILPGANNMNGAGGSNLTSTGTGKISMTSASAKTFTGGTNSYNIISQDGAGALDILGGSTFKSIRNTVQPVTITFEPGTTTTFTDGFELSGTVGNLVTLTSSDAATQYTLSKASGSVTVSYITISYTVATGGSSWIACTDQGAVDGGNNSGWTFTSCASTGNMLLIFL